MQIENAHRIMDENKIFVSKGGDFDEFLFVKGAHTSPNGKQAVLYVEGHHPDRGRINNKSLDGEPETIILLKTDNLPNINRNYKEHNPDGSIKEKYLVKWTNPPLSYDIIGKQIAINGTCLEVYLSGSHPGIGIPHIGWRGEETLIKIPAAYEQSLPSHFRNSHTTSDPKIE